jgi:hypothetical protein
MSDLMGRFYFKRTSNGNLIGEFSNNKGETISTESADLIGDGKGFCGDYNSTWQEKGEKRFANLNIKYKYDRTTRIFSVEWKEKNKLTFKGEGMLCDDILIGDYVGLP